MHGVGDQSGGAAMEEDTAEAAEERDPIEEAEICVDSAAELKARVFGSSWPSLSLFRHVADHRPFPLYSQPNSAPSSSATSLNRALPRCAVFSPVLSSPADLLSPPGYSRNRLPRLAHRPPPPFPPLPPRAEAHGYLVGEG